MGLLGQPLDIFNSPTPILILAVAAGHAVQLLKRYYEEYEQAAGRRACRLGRDQREAVVRSLVGVGPVMMIAGGVAAIGFFSLMVFAIPTIRAFGIFTGIGILSAAVLEMTFIPAVRSLLKPPDDKDLSRRKPASPMGPDPGMGGAGNWCAASAVASYFGRSPGSPCCASPGCRGS